MLHSEPNPGPMRSALYPTGWAPGMKGPDGRFLHDFSYAGYRRGEAPPPNVSGPVFDVTSAPYSADSTGASDATRAIQSAIDAAGDRGGGVVHLPAGTYKISLPNANTDRILILSNRGVVLRGAGADKTFLKVTSTAMRRKTAIAVMPTLLSRWTSGNQTATPLSEDGASGATVVRVKDPGAVKVGDTVLARIDLTARLIAELGMGDHWKPDTTGPCIVAFCRRVVAVSPGAGEVTLDVPVRFPLRVEDGARLELLGHPLLSEIGLEDFSIGMVMHPGRGLSELDHGKPGTVGYDVNMAYAIAFQGVENGWVRGVRSWRPPENTTNIHLLSGGIKMIESRFITVENCYMGFPQYRGGGGDGYLFQMRGQECLVKNSVAEAGRHNFTYGFATASGNVLSGCRSIDGVKVSDFHMYLSMANLIEGMAMDGDCFDAVYRPYGNWGGSLLHGVTTTETVFWNTVGLKYSQPRWDEAAGKETTSLPIVIRSKQFRSGYVIGTSGPASQVETGDGEWVEGVGIVVEPKSLYEDQKRRRLEK